MPSVKELLHEASSAFVESDTPMLDAQLLLAEALDVERVWLLTWDDAEVAESQEARFRERVQRRIAGEPIAYILGKREFWGLEFQCNASTLIPRPDTERLVEVALQLDLPKQARVLELGTGTGCIALSVASERPDWQILATDYSPACVDLAEQNCLALGINNVKIIQSDWYGSVGVDKRFDLILSNPPYIDPASSYLEEGDVRFEPDTALTALDSGLDSLRQVIHQAPDHLQSKGRLAVEHGFDQAGAVERLMSDAGFTDISLAKDLAGLDRCSIGRTT